MRKINEPKEGFDFLDNALLYSLMERVVIVYWRYNDWYWRAIFYTDISPCSAVEFYSSGFLVYGLGGFQYAYVGL